MDFDKQIKLQAHLDGELSEKEAREVTRWLAQDQEAVLMQAELRNTRQAIKGAEGFMALPETREFFWSKVKREIERQEPVSPVVEKGSWMTAWRRLLIPASAIAVLAIAALISIGPIDFNRPGSMAEIETSYGDTGAFSYRDEAAQATLVWLSYPADNEVADSDAADTVQ